MVLASVTLQSSAASPVGAVPVQCQFPSWWVFEPAKPVGAPGTVVHVPLPLSTTSLSTLDVLLA